MGFFKFDLNIALLNEDKTQGDTLDDKIDIFAVNMYLKPYEVRPYMFESEPTGRWQQRHNDRSDPDVDKDSTIDLTKTDNDDDIEDINPEPIALIIQIGTYQLS